MLDTFDVAVIGAGISGLGAARCYLDIHPDSKLVILERDAVLGGTWSTNRLYDHFWTQWSMGHAEFSDMPMKQPPKEDTNCGFFRSKHTTAYLEAYADHHNFSGRSLRDRIRFGFLVDRVERSSPGEWIISGFESSAPTTMSVKKLFIASGITSVPAMPKLPGSGAFGCPIIHQMHFGSSDVLSAVGLHHITVLGAGKSSADMVYACIKAGKKVSWIVRPTGAGPAFFLPPDGKGPFKSAFDLGSTRVIQTMSPSILVPDTWWTRFLHGTSWGIALVKGLWGSVDQQARDKANYKGRDQKTAFARLEPHAPFFWQNGPAGLLHHNDMFELFAEKVDVRYDEIVELKDHAIILRDDKPLSTDALLCGTGWQHSVGYFSDALRAELGLPSSSLSEEEANKWTQLEQVADKEVIAKFPMLANPPSHHSVRPDASPFRLYKHIVPIQDASRSIAVIGLVTAPNYFRVAECQARWATAYFDGVLQLPALEERQREVSRFVAWNRRRYLSGGGKATNMTFESIAYTDKLLEQLGLSSHLKGGWKDLFYPFRPSDLSGLVREYKAKYR